MGFFIFARMRFLLCFFALLLLHCFLHERVLAQDTLYKKNGELIVAKVQEIRPDEISYKLLSNLNGPIYLVKPGEIQFIRFSNGTKQFFEPAEATTNDYALNGHRSKTKGEIPDLYQLPIAREGNLYHIGFIRLPPVQVDRLLMQQSDSQINLMTKAAKKNKRWSKLLTFATIPCGVGFYSGVMIGSSVTNNGNLNSIAYLIPGGFAVVGIGSAVAAFVLNAHSKKIRREAVDLYNHRYFE